MMADPTPQMVEAYEATIEHGTQAAAAKALGIPHGTLHYRVIQYGRIMGVDVPGQQQHTRAAAGGGPVGRLRRELAEAQVRLSEATRTEAALRARLVRVTALDARLRKIEGKLDALLERPKEKRGTRRHSDG